MDFGRIEKLLENCLFSESMVLNLINDLLDLAKMQNGKFTLHEEFFDLNKTIKQAFKTLEFLAKEKKIQLQCVYINKVYESREGIQVLVDVTRDQIVSYFEKIMGDKRRYL